MRGAVQIVIEDSDHANLPLSRCDASLSWPAFDLLYNPVKGLET
jgi:hypothetical protein